VTANGVAADTQLVGKTTEVADVAKQNAAN